MYIYKITNIINGKVYIGKTERDNPKERWYEHLKNIKKGTHVNKHLQSSFNKYGKDAFVFETICKKDTVNELNIEEETLIREYNSYNSEFGYNKTFGGDGGLPTVETRKKLSECQRGKTLSSTHIQKLKESHTGLKLSESAKKKLSEYWKGKSKGPFGIKSNFYRNCPVCHEILYHKTKDALMRAIKKSVSCRKCAAISGWSTRNSIN